MGPVKLHPRAAVGVAALFLFAACGGGATTGARSPSPSGTSPSPAASPSPTASAPASPATGSVAVAWRRISASGPSARRDATFTGDGAGGAWLFGGRNDAGPLGDLWLFRNGSWTKTAATGPKPRFGHNAAYIRGRLFVFGGQAGPSEFFNDVWAYDPASEGWLPVSASGAKPAARYGAGGDAVGDAFVVTHGFTNSGRFDDTWRLLQPGSWTNVSPPSGRPIKRCLHRAVYVPGIRKMLLFGGQTNGVPFLGDTWLYDTAGRTWTQVRGAAPGARNVYAAVARESNLVLFGGESAAGPRDDVWRFDGATWRQLSVAGAKPSARSGIEGALVGSTMLVFGGTQNGTLLADLWELTLP